MAYNDILAWNTDGEEKEEEEEEEDERKKDGLKHYM